MPATPDSVDLSVVSPRARRISGRAYPYHDGFISRSADHYCRDVRASIDDPATGSFVLHSGNILNHSRMSIGVDCDLKLNAELVCWRKLTDSDSYRTGRMFKSGVSGLTKVRFPSRISVITMLKALLFRSCFGNTHK